MKDGGPAFPRQGQAVEFGDGWLPAQEGMSLRDWFATMASQDDINHILWGDDCPPNCSPAEARYRHADAMLAEREKPRELEWEKEKNK